MYIYLASRARRRHRDSPSKDEALAAGAPGGGRRGGRGGRCGRGAGSSHGRELVRRGGVRRALFPRAAFHHEAGWWAARTSRRRGSVLDGGGGCGGRGGERFSEVS